MAEDLDHFLQVVSTILSFFLTAMVYPEVQAKAQAELDRVIGRDRLPTLEDRKDLPYIDCMVWECVRWNPGRLHMHGMRTRTDTHCASSHTDWYCSESYGRR